MTEPTSQSLVDAVNQLHAAREAEKLLTAQITQIANETGLPDEFLAGTFFVELKYRESKDKDDAWVDLRQVPRIA